MPDLTWFEGRFFGQITEMHPSLFVATDVDLEGKPEWPATNDVVSWRLLADLKFQPADYEEHPGEDFLGYFSAGKGGGAANVPIHVMFADREATVQDYRDAGKAPDLGSIRPAGDHRKVVLILPDATLAQMPVLAAALPQPISFNVCGYDSRGFRISELRIGKS